MRLIPCTGERFMVAGGGRFLLSQVQDAAQLLREGYAQQVQLIYLDPPFGTGTSFYAKVPGGQAPVQAPAYTDRMEQAAYLSMMEETLGLCYDLLAPTGAVYVHIDHRMSAYIRLLMDEIFGAGNFVNEIIWAYRSGGRATRYFSRKHDNILFYRKSRQMYFNIQAVGTPRGPGRRNHMKRTVDEQGRIAYTIRSGGREYIYREDALMYPGDVWEDIGHLHQRDPERTGYSTQKPQALLERIIKASSRPGDLVMDLFCGSGTTAAAAWRWMRRRWPCWCCANGCSRPWGRGICLPNRMPCGWNTIAARQTGRLHSCNGNRRASSCAYPWTRLWHIWLWAPCRRGALYP